MPLRRGFILEWGKVGEGLRIAGGQPVIFTSADGASILPVFTTEVAGKAAAARFPIPPDGVLVAIEVVADASGGLKYASVGGGFEDLRLAGTDLLPVWETDPGFQEILQRGIVRDHTATRAGERRTTHRPFLAVRAIIPDAEGRVLVLQRAPRSMAAGRWCLPGGKVDFGETAEETTRKEIREETGLICEAARFLFYQDSLPGPETPLHFVNLYFECRVAGDVALNSESSEFAWVARDEVEAMALVFQNDEGLWRYWREG